VDLAAFRRSKDDFFRRGHDSPLTDEQRASFTGLRYFDEAPALSFTLALEPSADGAEEIQMSDGSTDEMPRVGTFSFTVDGTPVRLAAFASGAGSAFVPFRDATSGGETYGAGRYVEAERLPDGRYVLDFDHAYNPYCAYNEKWRCPLPPRENWLTVAIRAGELVFPH